jgi:hypothetical protein
MRDAKLYSLDTSLALKNLAAFEYITYVHKFIKVFV